jgi:DNA-binding transcriptional regulator GbsR (MarR family)
MLPITDAQHRFIEDMGQHMVGWGLPRNTGRVYAYLLLQPGPIGLDLIAADLEIAKSGASVATRQLTAFGLARSLGSRGSRRVRYEAQHNLEAIFNARNTQARDLRERFREGASVAPPGPGRQRLEDMVDMLDELLSVVPSVLQQIRERRAR